MIERIHRGDRLKPVLQRWSTGFSSSPRLRWYLSFLTTVNYEGLCVSGNIGGVLPAACQT